MFTKDHVTSVTASGIRTKKNTLLADTIGTSGVSASAFTGGQYNYFMSGLLPATPDLPDSTALAYFYRDIYLHDNVGGSCVDIQSTFPFSDWELRGLEDKDLEIFNNALTRLNMLEMLPRISMAYMVDGFYTGSLIVDPKVKNFMDILTHDALQCNLTASPFNNIDPKIQVTVSGETMQFINNPSDYARQYLQTMPPSFVSLLKEGSFVLDPVTTLFLARRGLTDRPYQSYLHRLLPMYLLEKTMYRGTLVEAQRRQRAMTHLTAGDDIWTPSAQELQLLAERFQQAERDPLGGWITTRNSVTATDVRPGGEFWKWTDMSDVLTPYKLRALGISEALLSGDASYAASDSAFAVFLETTQGYRSHLTHSIFYKKLFPLLGIANELYKDKTKKSKTNSIVDFIYNTVNHNNLKQPVLHWHKDLSGKTEDNLMDMLEKVSEKGVPIPLKMWLAAGGIDKDTLIRDAREDKELRKELGVAENSPQDVEDEGHDQTQEDSDDINNEKVTSASANSSWAAGGFRKKSILDRTFDGEFYNIGKTGKKEHVLNSNAKIKDQNWQIAKLAAKFKNPEVRERARRLNLKTLGIDRLAL